MKLVETGEYVPRQDEIRHVIDSKGREVFGVLLEIMGYQIPESFIDNNSAQLLGKSVWAIIERVRIPEHFNPTSEKILVEMGRPLGRESLVWKIREVEEKYQIGRQTHFPIQRWRGLVIASEETAAV